MKAISKPLSCLWSNAASQDILPPLQLEKKIEHSIYYILVGSFLALASMFNIAQADQLISVDLQSSFGSEGRDFSGVESEAAAANPVFAIANAWNHIGTTGFDVLTDVSGLVDSTGATTSVGFKTGRHSAYGDASFGPSDLLNDYFFWVASLNGSDTLDWELNGLSPGATYILFLNGSNSDESLPRQFGMTVDINGNDVLSDDVEKVVASPPGTLFASVVADSSGKIHGQGRKLGSDEPNWGGFQLYRVDALADSDGDGVPDSEDACPTSVTTPTVLVGGCNTGVANSVGKDGCTLADELSVVLRVAATGAKNHGKFVSSMAHYLNGLVGAGVINLGAKDAIMACVGPAKEGDFLR